MSVYREAILAAKAALGLHIREVDAQDSAEDVAGMLGLALPPSEPGTPPAKRVAVDDDGSSDDGAPAAAPGSLHAAVMELQRQQAAMQGREQEMQAAVQAAQQQAAGMHAAMQEAQQRAAETTQRLDAAAHQSAETAQRLDTELAQIRAERDEARRQLAEAVARGNALAERNAALEARLAQLEANGSDQVAMDGEARNGSGGAQHRRKASASRETGNQSSQQ